MYKLVPRIVRRKDNTLVSSDTMPTENKEIDIGQSATKQNDIPGHSLQKRKRALSDSQLSLKELEAKKKRLDTLTTHVTDEDNSFAGLPNEMFHMILEYVGTSDLLNCRQVNRKWNDISSQIIRGRDDITIDFEFINGQFVQQIDHRHREKLFDSTTRMGSKTLADIVNCIQDSDQFPFTSYRFFMLPDLRNSDMRDFLTVFGKEIRSFEIDLINRAKGICETLRKLVFEEAPNLKTLGIQYNWDERDPSHFRRLVESTNQLQLPKLEVLRNFFVSSKVLEAMMMSLPNLKSISFGRPIYTKDLQILRRAGKLHCLKNVHLVVEQKIITPWLECGLQLQSLNLMFYTVPADQQRMSSYTKAVDQTLQSSKNTLRSFTTEPLGFLTGLTLPRFEKLRKLCLRPYRSSKKHSLLPPVCNLNDAFPNLKELDIDFEEYFLDTTFLQSLKTLPNVETLRIHNGNQNDIRILMKFTPNVKTLVIDGDRAMWYGGLNVLVDLLAISTFLPKLENFGWGLITGTKDISRIPHMYNFDAAVTGLPADLCRKLAKKFRNKDKLSAAEIAKYHSKKSQRSFLDLKGLKNFHVKLFVDAYVVEEWAVDTDSDDIVDFDLECNSEITKVSKFLGFDLMPNLKFFVH